MTADDVRIEYRPLRVGLCVRDGNVADLVKAATLNSLLWGGIYNPIIPVGAREELDDRLVSLFQIDLLFGVNP